MRMTYAASIVNANIQVQETALESALRRSCSLLSAGEVIRGA